MSFFKKCTNGDIKYYIERLEEFVRDLDYEDWDDPNLSDVLISQLKYARKLIGKGDDDNEASKRLVEITASNEKDFADLLERSAYDNVRVVVLEKRVTIKNTLKSRIRRRNLNDEDLGRSIYVSGENYRYLDGLRKKLSKPHRASMNDVISNFKKTQRKSKK